MTRPESLEENVLPAILRGWFGEEAGRPGRAERVVFERRGDEYATAPLAADAPPPGPPPWERFMRADILKQFGDDFRSNESQVGVVQRTGGIFLMVTLEKQGMQTEYKYGDRFLSPTEFEWQSQNRTSQESELGRDLRRHRELGIDVHLFVRRSKRARGRAAPFVYCGRLEFERKGEKPITVWWRLEREVPRELWGELGVPDA